MSQLISSFPPELRELALRRQWECTTGYSKDTDALLHAFDWGKTPEEHNFWSTIYDEGVTDEIRKSKHWPKPLEPTINNAYEIF